MNSGRIKNVGAKAKTPMRTFKDSVAAAKEKLISAQAAYCIKVKLKPLHR